MSKIIRYLEMARWHAHNEQILPERRKLWEKYIPLSDQRSIWWKENGAFISTLPRGIGKTAMIKDLTEEMEDRDEEFIVMASSVSFAEKLKKHRGIKEVYAPHTMPEGLEFSNTHLFVDEYQRIVGDTLNQLLKHEWKSVSLFGTLI